MAPLPDAPPSSKGNLFSWSWNICICGGPLALAAWMFLNKGNGWWIIALLSAVLIPVFILHTRHWKNLKRERAQDSICTFSRLLPAKHHDTWIVRAVYEGISKERGVSIRPSDRLEKDLGYGPDDLDEVIHEIAHRAAKNLASTDANPLYGKVITVRDLICFLEYQPRSQNVVR